MSSHGHGARDGRGIRKGVFRLNCRYPAAADIGIRILTLMVLLVQPRPPQWRPRDAKPNTVRVAEVHVLPMTSAGSLLGNITITEQ